MALETLFYHYWISHSTVSPSALHTVKKEHPTFSRNLEQIPLCRPDTLWPTDWCWSEELSQLHQLFKPHHLKMGKLFYFSREDITVSNTITQKRFTSGNQHLVFAEAFLIPYLISLWAPIKLVH